jgi:hypothetical protein
MLYDPLHIYNLITSSRLQTIASSIAGCLRAVDAGLLCRITDMEFMLMIPDMGDLPSHRH